MKKMFFMVLVAYVVLFVFLANNPFPEIPGDPDNGSLVLLAMAITALTLVGPYWFKPALCWVAGMIITYFFGLAAVILYVLAAIVLFRLMQAKEVQDMLDKFSSPDTKEA